MSDSLRSLLARAGGLAKAARYDTREATLPARLASEARWERLAREDAEARGEQPTDAEIQRRAEALKKLHFTRMALRSAQVRAARKAVTPASAKARAARKAGSS